MAIAPSALLLCVNYTEPMRLLYLRVPNVDILMHLLGGMSIAFMLFILVQHEQWWPRVPALWRLVLLVGFAGLFGIAWEWYEFLSDIFLNTRHQPSLTDTMGDFFYDLAGGVFLSMAAFGFEGLRK